MGKFVYSIARVRKEANYSFCEILQTIRIYDSYSFIFLAKD